MKKVETLTLQEAMDVFRGYEVPMGYETLTALVDSGSVPWAVSGRGGGKIYRKIFKRPLVEWLEGMAVEV